MQVVRNIGHIKEQRRAGRRMTAFGFTALALAFVMVFWQRQQPALILVSYALMLFGYIFFSAGIQTVGKYVSNKSKKRSDEYLDKAMERLSDRYTIIHYAKLGKRVVDHLLVHNNGVLVLTVREVDGKINVNGRRWRRQGNLLRRFLNYGAPQLGNPTLDNEADVTAVKETLGAAGLPQQVEGAVVFTHPQAEVSGDSPLDVLGIDEVADHARQLANSDEFPTLTAKDRLAIVATLSSGSELEQATARPERRKRAA